MLNTYTSLILSTLCVFDREIWWRKCYRETWRWYNFHV